MFKGIGCVLETGARIPEMNDGIIIDINKILPAQPRLLLPAAKPTEAKQVEPDDALDEAEATSKSFVEIDRQSPSTGDLTSEQRKEFEEFLRFKRDKNDGKSEASDTE